MSFLIKIGAQDHLRDICADADSNSVVWHEGYLCALVDIGALTEEEYDELMNEIGDKRGRENEEEQN